MKTPPLASLKKGLAYPVRITIAALMALLASRGVGLPESYWAPISAIVVTQADFSSSLLLSWHRLVGTFLGAFFGALVAEFAGRGLAVFGLSLLGVGVLSVALRLDRAANRFAAIAFTVVLLITHAEPPWVVALHRFIEVSTGIVAGLLLSTVWPEPKARTA